MIKVKKGLSRFIAGALQGNFIGLVITLISSYASGSSRFMTAHFANQNTDVLIAMIVWCLIGGIAGLSSLIFDFTDWGITKATIIQFLMSYVPALAMAIIINWIPLNLSYIIIFSILYTIAFFIIWFIYMKSTQNKIEQLNQALRSKKM
ncbi:DUF3021 domain-containing protein [Holzapfeliella sp. JNUCC 72]